MEFKYLLITVCALLASVANAKVVITRADAVSNKDYTNIDIKVINKTEGTYVDVTVDLYKNIEGKMFVSFEIFKKIGGIYRSLIVMSVRNICGILAEKSDTPMIDFAISMLSQFGTVPSSCPIEKGHFVVKDFKIPDIMISPFVVGGEYQVIYQTEDHNVEPAVVVSTTTVQVTMMKDSNSNPENIKKLLKLLA
jgi:Protein of unknown function (DUF1091)